MLCYGIVSAQTEKSSFALASDGNQSAGFAPPRDPSIFELVVIALAWRVIAAVLSYLFFIAQWRWRGGRSQCPSRPSSQWW